MQVVKKRVIFGGLPLPSSYYLGTNNYRSLMYSMPISCNVLGTKTFEWEKTA